MNNYINNKTTDQNVPSFEDSTQGKETALKLISKGWDVAFGVGGDTVNTCYVRLNWAAMIVDGY
jgi:basic membrane lipoprotein Med (substrate-binding protein (PBP1-ABC) superfamily)